MKIIKAVIAFIVKWVKKIFIKQNCCKRLIFFQLHFHKNHLGKKLSVTIYMLLTLL